VVPSLQPKTLHGSLEEKVPKEPHTEESYERPAWPNPLRMMRPPIMGRFEKRPAKVLKYHFHLEYFAIIYMNCTSTSRNIRNIAHTVRLLESNCHGTMVALRGLVD
jgi:hypothetical protein